MMTTPKQRLEEVLKHHDWYYEYSDDYSVWKNGHLVSVEISKLIKEANLPEEELTELINQYKPKNIQ